MRILGLIFGLACFGLAMPGATARASEATAPAWRAATDSPLASRAKQRRKKRRRHRRRKIKAKAPTKKVVPPTPVVPKVAPKVVAKERPAPAAKPVDPNEPKPLKLAAFDITSTNKTLDSKLLRVLSEVMLSVIGSDGRFEQVITGADLRAMIDLEAQKTMLGCESAGCLTQIGRALDVPYLLTGEIGTVGSKIFVNMKIMDIAAASVLARQGGMAEQTSELPEVIKDLAGKALVEFFAKVKPDAAAIAQTELEDLPAVAVLDLEAVHGVKASMAAVLSDILLSRLTECRKFSSIIAGEDLRDMISMEQQKVALGCDDESCMTALGGALGVPLMAVPSIGRVGDQFVLNLKIMEVEEATVRVRKNRMVRREVDLPAAVLGITDDALKELFGAESLMTAAQVTNRFQRKLMRGSSLAIGLAALATWGYSTVELSAAQAAFDDPETGKSEQTYSDLLSTQQQVFDLRVGGLIGGALGAALWIFAPGASPL